ncbi:MAG: restriction endonuclease subunit S [Bacteroidales bacterium]|nr:restriction endonuclease subunit S [Bacteroidales bacterium]
MKKIKELVDIRFGVNGKATNEGAIPYIQGKDFNGLGQFKNKEIFLTKKDAITEKDLLKKDDILFTGKGSRNYAVVWNGEISEAVASSTFYILTLKVKDILPEFLAWYLNSDRVQSFLRKVAKGATISNIPKNELQGLSVNLPSIEEQHKIVEVDKLRLKEQILMRQLAKNRDMLVRKLLSNKIK